LSFSFFLVSFTSLTAQQSAVQNNEISTFQEGLDLFQKKQFASAKILFTRVAESTSQRQLKSNAKFYEISSGLKLNEANAAIAMKIYPKPPTSTNAMKHFFRLGITILIFPITNRLDVGSTK